MKLPTRKISTSATVPLPPNASQPTGETTPPVLPVGLESYNLPAGMEFWKIGDEIKLEGLIFKCQRVTESGSTFKSNGKTIYLSACHEIGQKLNFSGGQQVLTPEDNEQQDDNESEIMANTKKPADGIGKIEFIDSLLKAGKLDKKTIQAQAEKRFKGIGKNTTNWCASTYKKRHPVKSTAKLPTRKAK